MRIGLVVDSACDLPLSFLRENNVEVMPIALRFGDDRYVDLRDPEATVAFYERYISRHGLEAETEPFKVSEIRDLFLNRLVTRFERVLVISIASSRSDIYSNSTKASFAILKGYRERREAANLEGNFMLRVVDSGQLFTGEGVLVWEALRLLREQEGAGFDRLRQHVEDFKRHVYAYAVPRDLYHLRERARRRGDHSVGWLQFQLGSMLDIKPIVEAHRGDTRPVEKVRHFETAVEHVMERAIERIRDGRLLAPVVVMSYAGSPDEIRSFATYRTLRRQAEDHDVAIMESPMSTTAGVYLGPGAFSLAYAANG